MPCSALHSPDEYLWQVPSKSFHEVDKLTASREMFKSGQRTDKRPQSIMPLLLLLAAEALQCIRVLTYSGEKVTVSFSESGTSSVF